MSNRILRTDHLFLGNGRSIPNGMVEVDSKGKILDFGNDLAAESEAEYFPGGLSPSFINTHCHLELSHMIGKVDQKTGLDGFITSLQSQREVDTQTISEAIGRWDDQMYSEGIKAVGDISNGNETIKHKASSKIYYHSFIELFGLRDFKADELIENGIALREEYHAQGLSASLSDVDGSESLTGYSLTGIPTGVFLTDGANTFLSPNDAP